jgi:transcriptional regulator with XRE-family HTH domain
MEGGKVGILGRNIRKYRNERGLTQRQLASKIGVKHNTISDWERGICEPDANKLEYICGALDVDANTLLGWDDPAKIKKDVDRFVEMILNNKSIQELLPELEKLDEKSMELVKTIIDGILKNRK